MRRTNCKPTKKGHACNKPCLNHPVVGCLTPQHDEKNRVYPSGARHSKGKTLMSYFTAAMVLSPNLEAENSLRSSCFNHPRRPTGSLQDKVIHRSYKKRRESPTTILFLRAILTIVSLQGMKLGDYVRCMYVYSILHMYINIYIYKSINIKHR